MSPGRGALGKCQTLRDPWQAPALLAPRLQVLRGDARCQLQLGHVRVPLLMLADHWLFRRPWGSCYIFLFLARRVDGEEGVMLPMPKKKAVSADANKALMPTGSCGGPRQPLGGWVCCHPGLECCHRAHPSPVFAASSEQIHRGALWRSQLRVARRSKSHCGEERKHSASPCTSKKSGLPKERHCRI